MSHEMDQRDLKDTDVTQLEDTQHLHGGVEKNHVVADNEAAEYVDPTLVLSPEESKRLRNKAFKRVLPIMMVAYVTQSLDKGTLGSSSIMGWQADVGAVGQDYALTSTFLYIGIIIGEPIVNQCIRRFPVGKILGYSMIVWSALLFGITFSLSVGPVFALRTLLGLFESSFNPCLVAITIQWFTVQEQTLIVTFWQLMFVLANFIASLLAYGFYSINGAGTTRANGLYTWQWMTLCISIISSIASVIVVLFLPDSPAHAKWATEEEKTKFIERVRGNDQGIKQKVWRKSQAVEALTDPLPWLLCGMILFETLIVGGLNTFNSLLINTAFGFSVANSQLLGLPLAVFQGILYLLIGWLGTKTRNTIYCMVGYIIVNIVGTIVLIVVAPNDSNKGGLLFTFYLMQCCQAVSPSMWSMLSRNVAGQTKKSITYALFFIAWAGGNAIGPQLFVSNWAPRYINTLYIHIGIYILFILDVLVLRWVMVRRNKSRDVQMEAMHQDNRHVQAFDDMTDRQNIEFRYSY